MGCKQRLAGSGQRSLSHSIAFRYSEHAEQGKLGALQECEQILCRLLQRGRYKAEVHDSPGGWQSTLVKQVAIVSIEGKQHPGLTNSPLEHDLVRDSGRILHHGYDVMASCREDSNAR
jgi:hypothetical protein